MKGMVIMKKKGCFPVLSQMVMEVITQIWGAVGEVRGAGRMLQRSTILEGNYAIDQEAATRYGSQITVFVLGSNAMKRRACTHIEHHGIRSLCLFRPTPATRNAFLLFFCWKVYFLSRLPHEMMLVHWPHEKNRCLCSFWTRCCQCFGHIHSTSVTMKLVFHAWEGLMTSVVDCKQKIYSWVDDVPEPFT